VNWVIKFSQEQIDKLGPWQQEHFCDPSQGGNGLFAECLKSKLTVAQVEKELLAFISRYCPEGECPLAGSSIQSDKVALKRCMPKVNAYLHYRIIDVSSFQGILIRWMPGVEHFLRKGNRHQGDISMTHRAMEDINRSIEFMEHFRTFLKHNK
jgi:oligoribonuclease